MEVAEGDVHMVGCFLQPDQTLVVIVTFDEK